MTKARGTPRKVRQKTMEVPQKSQDNHHFVKSKHHGFPWDFPNETKPFNFSLVSSGWYFGGPGCSYAQTPHGGGVTTMRKVGRCWENGSSLGMFTRALTKKQLQVTLTAMEAGPIGTSPTNNEDARKMPQTSDKSQHVVGTSHPVS